MEYMSFCSNELFALALDHWTGLLVSPAILFLLVPLVINTTKYCTCSRRDNLAKKVAW
jgi:hypothetical protein